MDADQTYAMYILASRSRVLYVGVTRDLHRRIAQHRTGEGSSFTAKYQVYALVYVEFYSTLMAAVSREKQIKRWNRTKKETLICRTNPDWRDLFDSQCRSR